MTDPTNAAVEGRTMSERRDWRLFALGIAIVALALILGGCNFGQGSDSRDLEGVPLTDPQKIEVYANVNGHPNIVRLCIDGRAFITTTRARFAMLRADYWDGWCNDQ
jgi:hypothetical protein